MVTKFPLAVHWHTGSAILDPDQFVQVEGEPLQYVRPDLPPGAARFSDSKSGQPHLFFVCPCGCGDVGCLPLEPMPGRKGWRWNADRVFPTLRPSIAKRSRCAWHGWLVKGFWTLTPPPAED